jgi:hypothetical protein
VAVALVIARFRSSFRDRSFSLRSSGARFLDLELLPDIRQSLLDLAVFPRFVFIDKPGSEIKLLDTANV